MTPAELRGDALPTPAAWRMACPWLPAVVRARRVFVGPAGELLRVDNLGHLDVVVSGGMPFNRSIAAAPDAARSR